MVLVKIIGGVKDAEMLRVCPSIIGAIGINCCLSPGAFALIPIVIHII